jgi:hypothetical protein
MKEAIEEFRTQLGSMYADEKSDEVVVPRKRANKGRQQSFCAGHTDQGSFAPEASRLTLP